MKRSVGVPSLRELLAHARRIGLDVSEGRGTDHILVRVPGHRILRIKATRKDATPQLLKLVLTAERQRAA